MTNNYGFSWQQDGKSGNEIFTDGTNWIEGAGGDRYTLHLENGDTATYHASSLAHAAERAQAFINPVHVTLTGRVIDGCFFNAALESCKPVDYPTGERAEFVIDGERQNRAIIRRDRWRANAANTTLCEFVQYNGKQYEIARA